MKTDFERELYCLGGLPFDSVTLKMASEKIDNYCRHGQRCFLSTPNLNFLIACQTDKAFRDSVINSDLNVADGMPIIWMAKLLKLPLTERVAGSSLFDELGRKPDSDRPLKIFFFGGERGIARKACESLAVTHQNFICAGHIDPGFVDVSEMSKPEYINSINDSSADILVISLGAKKGQQWIVKNREQLTVPVVSHLGAVVNFVAGSVKRSPPWLQKFGLEWLWRIKEEPRLWYRYWNDAKVLVKLLLTRVIPYAFYLRSLKWEKASQKTVSVSVKQEPEKTVIFLQGRFSAANLEKIRSTFNEVVQHKRDVVLDMAEVEYLDSAFLGQVLLLKKYLSRSDKRLSLDNVGNMCRQLLEYCGAEYLLSN